MDRPLLSIHLPTTSISCEKDKNVRFIIRPIKRNRIQQKYVQQTKGERNYCSNFHYTALIND
jgi:hypothetical protein